MIELLIVVAIIAILALIAVPNFLEAQVRAKVSRVRADHRSLAVAMEAYYVDWNSYPWWDSIAQMPPAGRSIGLPGRLWWALSTPIAYLSSALFDPFVRPGNRSMGLVPEDLLDPFYEVGTGFLGGDNRNDPGPRTHWFALSAGPDWGDVTGSFQDYPYTRDANPYDPTNGTVSWGDVYRFDGRPPSNFLVYENLSGCQGHNQPRGVDPWGGLR